MNTLIVKNKKAYFDYEIIERYETGIELYGYEVKAIRHMHVNLKGSYISHIQGELWVKDIHIGVGKNTLFLRQDTTRRPRKIFLHKKKICYLAQKIQERGYTLIPLQMYFSGSLIKVEIALVRGKKQYQKKQTLKERTLDREASMMLKKRITH